ncbi:MAG: hypothetical protein KI790_19465 [Cyclobacteriaceae bacterium]|nr:hypothetical protein [Cyclobacteriaceae bacterium HetDA_MAG_MS6]
MDISSRLASSQNRRDQGPNKEFAEEIARTRDGQLLDELIFFLGQKPKVPLANDAVLVLTALSELAPEMLVEKVDFLVDTLQSNVSRQVFASMIALHNISDIRPQLLVPHLTLILDAMTTSIVAKDHGFSILCSVYTIPEQQENILHLVMEQIFSAPPNQLGQYTEKFMVVVGSSHINDFREALLTRREELNNEHHLKRLDKNLKKLRKLEVR